MVLQLLTGLAYEIVQASWSTATFAVPVYLAVRAGLSYLNDGFESLESDVDSDSMLFVSLIVLTGSISILAGFEPPRFKLVGDLIAVIFFGYLFWKF